MKNSSWQVFNKIELLDKNWATTSGGSVCNFSVFGSVRFVNFGFGLVRFPNRNFGRFSVSIFRFSGTRNIIENRQKALFRFETFIDEKRFSRQMVFYKSASNFVQDIIGG